MSTAARPGAGSATPVVDAVLLNPLAVPPGVGVWLRAWERRLRLAMRDATDQEPPGIPVPAWGEALAEVQGIDPDAEDGAFRLLLRRPLWQLEEASVARDTFDRYATTVLERLETARALLGAIGPLLAERRALVAEFGGRFPNRLAEQLAAVRARETDIARLRRAVDAERMRTRLGRARRALEGLAAVFHSAGDGFTDDASIHGETETLAEMQAALAIARGTRRRLQMHSSALQVRRGQLLAELRGLALSMPSADPAARTAVRRIEYTGVVLERLVNAAAREGSDAPGARDAPMWTGALAGALAAQHPGLDRFAWTPALLGVGAADSAAATRPMAEAELLHVVPLGNGLLYLSPDTESAVRVWTRTVRPGEMVECQVAPDMVDRHAGALVEADVAALFTGIDAEHSRWYATMARARARVVARSGGGWFARLEQRGSVTATAQPAWHIDGAGSAFRILRPSGTGIARGAGGKRDADVPVAVASDAPHAVFMGFTLREVRTGLRGEERAWVRGVTEAWPGSAEAVEREAELFARLHGHGTTASAGSAHGVPASEGIAHRHRDLALRPIAWGRLPDERVAYPLYRPPIATLDAPTRLRTWIVEREHHVVAVLADVARIVRATHAAGFALGACHTEAFAHALAWHPDPLTPVPTAVLAHAPCATRLGEPFAPPGAAGLTPGYYTMLRTPVLVPQVAGAQVATVERDMQAFGAFVLDLLLEQPVFARGTLDWFDAAAVVRARASQCSAHPTVAKHLADLIPEPLGWRRIGGMAARLASGTVTRLAELL